VQDFLKLQVSDSTAVVGKTTAVRLDVTSR